MSLSHPKSFEAAMRLPLKQLKILAIALRDKNICLTEYERDVWRKKASARTPIEAALLRELEKADLDHHDDLKITAEGHRQAAKRIEAEIKDLNDAINVFKSLCYFEGEEHSDCQRLQPDVRL